MVEEKVCACVGNSVEIPRVQATERLECTLNPLIPDRHLRIEGDNVRRRKKCHKTDRVSCNRLISLLLLCVIFDGYCDKVTIPSAMLNSVFKTIHLIAV